MLPVSVSSPGVRERGEGVGHGGGRRRLTTCSDHNILSVGGGTVGRIRWYTVISRLHEGTVHCLRGKLVHKLDCDAGH